MIKVLLAADTRKYTDHCQQFIFRCCCGGSNGMLGFISLKITYFTLSVVKSTK